jgi:diguanylate cyclase (GGDEF)-like protein/PAS domain S-box-containing protein
MPGYQRLLTKKLWRLSALWLLALALCLTGWSLLRGGNDADLRARTQLAAEVASAELVVQLGQPETTALLPQVRALLVRQDIGFAWIRVRDTQGYAVAAAGRLEANELSWLATKSLQRQIYSLISTEHRVPLMLNGTEFGSMEFGLLVGGGSLRGAGWHITIGMVLLLAGLPLFLFTSWRLKSQLSPHVSGGIADTLSVAQPASAGRTGRSLLSGSGDLITVFDRGALLIGRDQRVLDINDRAIELTNFTREAAIGQQLGKVLKLQAAESGAPVQLPVADILEGRQQRLQLATSLRLPLGEGHREVYIDAAPVRDAAGVIGAALVSLSTVNQRAASIQQRVPAVARSEQPDPRQLSQLLLDQMLECVISTDSQDRIRFANDRALANFGYTLVELRGQHISKLIPDPFLRNSQLRVADFALALPGVPAREVGARRRDGSRYAATLVVKPVNIRERQGHVITVSPVTPALAEGDVSAKLRQMIEGASGEVFAIDPEELKIVACNSAALLNLGFKAKELKGMPLSRLCPQLSYDLLRDQIADLRHGSTDRIEFRTMLQRSNNTRYAVESHLSLWCGEPEAMLVLAARAEKPGTFSSTAAATANELRVEVRHDGLTGLPNRMLFAERLQECMANSDLEQRPFLLVHLALPEFASLSQRSGHEIADRLLKVVADRLSATVRSADTVARMGNCEFSLLMTGLERRKDAADVLKRLNMALSRPLHADGQDVHILSCLGAALYPDDARSATQLLHHAGLALHQARLQGPGSACLYQPDLDLPERAAQLPEELLNEAQQQGHLHVELQVVNDIEARQPVGAELLMAWHYPGMGLLRTAEQVLKASKNEELAHRMGLWALERACEQLANWRDLELPSLPLIVNLTALPLAGRQDAQAVRGLLAQYRVAGEQIIVLVDAGELEGLVMKENRWLPVLLDFGLRLGVKEVDPQRSDLLRQSDIDVVQLTPDSIAGLPGSRDATERAEAAIQVAQRVGARVLATGVERAEQREALRALGCRYQQGRLFGEPQTPAALGRSLALSEIGAF